MARYFEKISKERFAKDVKADSVLYEEYPLPRRMSKCAAGYDFFALEDYELKPGEIKKIPTGVKVCMEEDEVLLLVVRSSMGFHYNVRACNQVGVIDADYYNNSKNEGHIWFCLQNEGTDSYVMKKGEGFCQGMFVKYLTVDSEESVKEERIGRY